MAEVRRVYASEEDSVSYFCDGCNTLRAVHFESVRNQIIGNGNDTIHHCTECGTLVVVTWPTETRQRDHVLELQIAQQFAAIGQTFIYTLWIQSMMARLSRVKNHGVQALHGFVNQDDMEVVAERFKDEFDLTVAERDTLDRICLIRNNIAHADISTKRLGTVLSSPKDRVKLDKLMQRLWPEEYWNSSDRLDKVLSLNDSDYAEENIKLCQGFSDACLRVRAEELGIDYSDIL